MFTSMAFRRALGIAALAGLVAPAAASNLILPVWDTIPSAPPTLRGSPTGFHKPRPAEALSHPGTSAADMYFRFDQEVSLANPERERPFIAWLRSHLDALIAIAANGNPGNNAWTDLSGTVDWRTASAQPATLPAPEAFDQTAPQLITFIHQAPLTADWSPTNWELSPLTGRQ